MSVCYVCQDGHKSARCPCLYDALKGGFYDPGSYRDEDDCDDSLSLCNRYSSNHTLLHTYPGILCTAHKESNARILPPQSLKTALYTYQRP